MKLIQILPIGFLPLLGFIPYPSFGMPPCPDTKEWEECRKALLGSGSSSQQKRICGRVPGLPAEAINPFTNSTSKSSIATESGNTSEYEAVKHYDAVVAKSRLLQLEQLSDSKVLDAQLGLKRATLQKQDFSSPVLQENIAGVYKQKRTFLKVSDITRQQVLPGTPLPPGDSLPSSRPLVKDPERNCARPALPTDYKPDEKGFLPILSYPAGFAEIGQLVTSRGTNINACGFILIHPEWGVTALHCVAQSVNGKAIVDALEVINEVPRTVVLLPDLKKPQQLLGECLSKNPSTSCPARILKALSIEVFDDEWSGKTPRTDLALVRMDPHTTTGLPVVPPNFEVVTPKVVTVAGYGTSNVDHRVGIGLLIGWHHNGRSTADNREYIWNRADDPNGTIQCTGDSGSAVYNGEFYGHSDEASKRKLFAVTSSLIPPEDLPQGLTAAEKCAHAISTTSVVLQGYKSWICEKASKISGCSN